MNLRTLDDMKNQNQKDKPKKKATTSYTGGESSGMAVENPDTKELLSKAEKNSKSPDEYAKEQKESGGSVCKITLYQNGFSVDDGEFQSNDDPKSKQFMAELNKGMIPKELKAKYPKGGLSVSLSDRTSEKYTPPPPPAYTAFSGEGASLGGPEKQVSKFAKKSKPQENFILEPNKDREITTMRVRLSNGSSITMQANLDSSLQDVHNHVATASGVSNFTLIGGFPPKPLDLSSTVEKSDLADSTLIQK